MHDLGLNLGKRHYQYKGQYWNNKTKKLNMDYYVSILSLLNLIIEL